MRTFVAIELDEHCRSRLRSAIETLSSVAGGVRWVRPDAIHLTLKFMGELPEQDLPVAVSCMGSVTAEAEPFSMLLSGLSGFPPTGVPKVIHVMVEEPTGALQSLQRGMESALTRQLRIKREERRFIPHVTLGRVRKRAECPRLEGLHAALPDQEFGQVMVDSIVMMKSDLNPSGPIYTVLQRFPLGQPG